MLLLHCAQGLAEEEFSGSPDSDSFFLFSVFLPQASTAAENISISGQVEVYKLMPGCIVRL